MRSRHKTQNIDMKSGHLSLMTKVNILAFFIVVASSQISPHSGHFPDASPCYVSFLGGKDREKFSYTNCLPAFWQKNRKNIYPSVRMAKSIGFKWVTIMQVFFSQ